MAANVAALTVYDMCISVSKVIVIREVKLLSKSGGKSDFSCYDSVENSDVRFMD